MTKYLIDSNVISLLFKENISFGLVQSLKSLVQQEHEIFMSSINFYEIRRGFLANNANEKLKRFEEFARTTKIILFNNIQFFVIASEIYAKLKKKGKMINEADILISAQAIREDLIIVSDDNDFRNVEGLELLTSEEFIRRYKY